MSTVILYLKLDSIFIQSVFPKYMGCQTRSCHQPEQKMFCTHYLVSHLYGKFRRFI